MVAPARKVSKKSAKPSGKSGSRPGSKSGKKSGPPKSPRALALWLIGQVKGQRKPIAEVLQSTPAYRALDPRDQSLVRALVTHFFRHHHALDAVFAPHLSRPLESLSPAALGPLRLGTVELLAMGSPAHATLNETVALTPKALRGLVNAVLRAVLKHEQESRARFNEALAVPPWLLEGWQTAYGEARAAALTNGLRQVPDLDLTLKPGADLDLGEAALEHHRRLPANDPRTLPGFEAGEWWVQDLAASLPVRLAGDVTGKTALDVCAAPGGKTLQLAAGGAQVTALDISKARLARVRENLDRTGLEAELICQDALTYAPRKPFDLILLDAPCSASGTLRRHPEWPWIHARKDQLAHVPTQAALLRRCLEWLKPGGTLIYAVCSLFPEEGEQQIEALLDAHPDARLVSDPVCPLPPQTWDIKKGWLRTTPNLDLNMDGFFAAVLEKV